MLDRDANALDNEVFALKKTLARRNKQFLRLQRALQEIADGLFEDRNTPSHIARDALEQLKDGD